MIGLPPEYLREQAMREREARERQEREARYWCRVCGIPYDPEPSE